MLAIDLMLHRNLLLAFLCCVIQNNKYISVHAITCALRMCSSDDGCRRLRMSCRCSSPSIDDPAGRAWERGYYTGTRINFALELLIVVVYHGVVVNNIYSGLVVRWRGSVLPPVCVVAGCHSLPLPTAQEIRPHPLTKDAEVYI